MKNEFNAALYERQCYAAIRTILADLPPGLRSQARAWLSLPADLSDESLHRSFGLSQVQRIIFLLLDFAEENDVPTIGAAEAGLPIDLSTGSSKIPASFHRAWSAITLQPLRGGISQQRLEAVLGRSDRRYKLLVRHTVSAEMRFLALRAPDLAGAEWKAFQEMDELEEIVGFVFDNE